MLYRVSCQACNLSCLWTDDPRSFLQSVCLRYRHCRAKLVAEASAAEARKPVRLPPMRFDRARDSVRIAAKLAT